MDPKGGLAFDADFVADTSKASAPVKEYIEQVKTLDKTIKEQARSARQQYVEQSTAARAAGASVEQLNSIQQKYNQAQFAIRETAKSLYKEIQNGNFDALKSEQELLQIRDRAIEKINQEIIAVKLLADAHKGEHGAEIGGAIAGGALIRTVDGGQNVRAVENFLSKTLGGGEFFQAIFPVVGAVAAIQTLGEMGEKIKELHDRAHEAGEELSRMTEDAHAKSALAVADIELQNSKLQDQIDKISGHPGNGLRTGILEAKKAADEFLVSLRADSRELDQIFAKEHVGSVAAWFSGSNPTSSAEGAIHDRLTNFDRDNEKIRSEMAARFAQAKTPEESDEINKEQQRRLSESARNVAKEFRQKQKDLQADNVVFDTDRGGKVTATQTNRNDAQIKEYGLAAEKLEGNANVYDARNRGAELDKQRLSAEQKKELERQAKEGASQAKAASRAALEAQKQADAEQLKQWGENYAAWDAAGNRSAQQKVDFWLEQARSVQIGSANYMAAMKHVFEDVKKLNEEQQRVQDEGRKMAQEFGIKYRSGLEGGALSRTGDAYAKGQGDAAKTGLELRQAQEDIALATRQASIEFDAQHGILSRYDAAVQLQQLHTEQYTLSLQRLQAQLAAVQPGPEADAQRNTIQRQMNELDGKRTVQQMQDSAAVAQTTVAGALKDANQVWYQNTRDLAPQLASVYSSVFSGMNDQLTNLLTGQKTSWGSFFRSMAASFAHIGLNSLEAGILGPLTSGKSSPSSTGGSAGGNVLSGVVRGIFGGFRASGGPVEAGKTYIVGEKGPEPVTFGASGTMGTARDLQSMMTGRGMDLGGIHIDARGASNPAEVEAAVHRAIPMYIPAILSAGMQMQQDRRDRLPMSKR